MEVVAVMLIIALIASLAIKPQRVAAVDLIATMAEGPGAAARAVITVLPQDSDPYRVLVFTPMPATGLR
jgi:hypothetical protein